MSDLSDNSIFAISPSLNFQPCLFLSIPSQIFIGKLELWEKNHFGHSPFRVTAKKFFHPDGIVPTAEFMKYAVKFSSF